MLTVRGFFLRAMPILSYVFACSSALAQNSPSSSVVPPISGNQGALAIEAGSGRVLTLRSPAANVFVADPKVAEVRPASATSLFVFGVGPGRTTVATMNEAGQLIAQYEVTVRPSAFNAAEAQSALTRLIPTSRVRVQPHGKGLLLTGQVNSPADAAQAVAIARSYLGENQTVENQLSIQSTMQVTLRVRIAEMSREVVQNLGIDWQALGNIAISATLSPLVLRANGAVSFNGVIDALARDNLARILAEPNLTVMSGQPASFLVGGEFPIPVGQQNGQITLEFKKYGITLAFLPTVFSNGRINLHVSPEVSQLSSQGAVQLSAGNSTLQIPALTVRRAETTVELGSGQTFAIAGLLQNEVTQGVNRLPFLGDIPVLGALFRSDSFQRRETELVILVTPIVVRPVDDIAALQLPTDGYTLPNDLERVLYGRQVNRSQSGPPAKMRIPGDAGFIVQ
jgi:pilus assembly protein CpaC